VRSEELRVKKCEGLGVKTKDKSKKDKSAEVLELVDSGNLNLVIISLSGVMDI
jgi:hypothetical protein